MNTKKYLARLALPLLFLLAAAGLGAAEGSRDLIRNDGYRPYIEYTTNYDYVSSVGGGTESLPRRQMIDVYVKKGETVSFGSNMHNSGWASTTGGDIRVTFPDGTSHSYDVLSNGTKQGYIIDPAMEKVGPSRVAGDGGYNSLAFTAPAEGVYRFEFFPGVINNDEHNPLPGEASLQWDGWCIGVGAWDVTVTGTDGQVKTGRMFAPYLTLNMGKNSDANRTITLNSVVYVLTADGYIYETDFNGMDPFGFLFFGNSRGLLKSGANGSTFYHSSIYGSNYFNDLKGQIGFRLPLSYTEDPVRGTTFRIFFNMPSAETLAYLGLSQPRTPAVPSSFLFNQGNVVLEGAGGDFTFVTDSTATTYEIELTFLGTTLDPVHFNGDCQTGTNTVHWDGKDAKGNTVGAGDFSAVLQLKSGEYHFPLADVENNPNGVKIRLMNVPADAADGYNPSMVFYDNSTVTVNGDLLDFDKNSANFTGSLSRLEGVNTSQEGALRYHSGYGDLKMFDLWTYYVSKQSVRATPVRVRGANTLTIIKTVEGDLTPAEKALLNPSFVIENPATGYKETVEYARFQNGSYTLPAVSQRLQPGNYTVTEQNAGVAGHTLTATFNGAPVGSATVTVTTNGAAQVSIVNAYAKDGGTGGDSSDDDDGGDGVYGSGDPWETSGRPLPQTGDASRPLPWLCALTVSACALLLLALSRRGRKQP